MIRIVFWTVIIVLFLSFFGISVQSLFESPLAQNNLSYVWNLVVSGFRFIATLVAPVIEWIVRLLA